MDIKYPCCLCNEECRNNAIECSICDSWIHFKCVPMTKDIITNWSDNDWNFVCRNCVFINSRTQNSKSEDLFDFRYALNRILGTPGISIDEHQERAKEIELLMRTYNIQQPPLLKTSSGLTDIVSKRLLQLYNPITLEKFNPIQTVGDGNCLYRAVSRLLYGTERHHIELRLRTSLEILLHQDYYVNASESYRNQIQDVFVVTSNYPDLIKTATKYGSYAELLHLYALSAATGFVMHSFFPPTDISNNYAKAFTRKVTGRGAKPLPSGDPVVMWTQTFVPSRASNFKPNHFVPLQPLPEEPNSIHVLSDDDCDSTDDSLQAILQECPFRYDDEFDRKNIESTAEDSDAMMAEDGVKPDDKDLDNNATLTCNIKGPAMGHLPNNAFLTSKDIITYLTQSDASVSSIPFGHKNNVFFIFDNSANVKRRDEGERSQFWDDCGAWTSESGSSPKSHFIKSGNKFISIHCRNGVFCKEQQVKGKRTFPPLDPQPDQQDVIVLQRAYATLKGCPKYKRRISWLVALPSGMTASQPNLGLAEYIGEYPGRSVHGNAKSSTIAYVRSTPELLTQIEDMAEHQGPRNTFDRLIHINEDPSLHPRSIDQVKNVRKKIRSKMKETETICQGNFADNIINICNITPTHPFLQSVNISKSRVPTIICYTKEQIEDIRRFCAKPCGEIWGFDKTFNLGDVFVTTSVFKNTSVTLRTTGDHPLFLGPVFLHGNSNFDTYLTFFSKLSSNFTDEEIANIIIGTDDEKAMRKAVSRTFFTSYNTVCTRHLKNNIKDYLTRKVPSSPATKQRVINLIFGDNGITSAEDQDVLNHKVESALRHWNDDLPAFVPYFKDRLLPILLENVCFPQQVRDVTNNWTNNNTESINHVLKVKTEWKQLKLTELALRIYEHVDAKYKDLKRALYNEGSFSLTEPFIHHLVQTDTWFMKTQEGRKTAFERFMRDKGRSMKKNQITSKSGALTVSINSSKSKKLNQIKRSRAEKTVSRKKLKKQ